MKRINFLQQLEHLQVDKFFFLIAMPLIHDVTIRLFLTCTTTGNKMITEFTLIVENSETR